MKEKIETGKVKFSVLMEYFRACGLVTVIGYILMYSLFNVTSVGSNVWLSKWTGDLKKNSSNAEENKYFHFLIFSLMGLAQCKIHGKKFKLKFKINLNFYSYSRCIIYNI